VVDGVARSKLQYVRCIDDRGRATAGCVVQVTTVDEGRAVATEQTDAAGRTAIRIPGGMAGTLFFRAATSDGLASGSVSHLVGSDSGVELELLLTPRCTLRGKVLDSTGVAAAGATVTCRLPGTVHGGATPVFDSEVVTDQTGLFALACDAQGSVVELVAQQGTGTSLAHRVQIPRDARVWIELRLNGPGHRVTGLVLDELSRPVEGATVSLRRKDTFVEVPPLSTDGAGRVEFSVVQAGAYELLAKTESALSTTSAVELSPERPLAEVILFLAQASTISGRVVDAQGRGLGTVEVVAMPDGQTGGHPVPFQSVSHSMSECEPDTGRFLLKGLIPDVVYDLHCYPDITGSERFVLESGIHSGASDVLIVLDERRIRGAAISGRVSVNGSAAPDGKLELFLKWRRPGREWSGGSTKVVQVVNGEYALDGLLPAHEYFVEVWRTRCARQCHGPWLAGVEDERADFSYGMDTSVEVTVRRSDGSPAIGWFVKLEETAGMPASLVGSTTRGPDGKATIRPVAPGKYFATLIHDSTVDGQFEIDVRAGGTNELTYELPPR